MKGQSECHLEAEATHVRQTRSWTIICARIARNIARFGIDYEESAEHLHFRAEGIQLRQIMSRKCAVVWKVFALILRYSLAII